VLRQVPSLKTGITYTTRSPREKASEDKVMRYISREAFEEKIQSQTFLEWAEYNGNYYGTSKETLTASADQALLLNLDIRGSLQIKSMYPESLLIFIAPENIAQIRERLERRNLSNTELAGRLQAATECLAGKDNFDHIVINKQGKVEETVSQVVKLIQTYLILDKKEENS
jgi:guanylate kinase